MKTYNTLVGAPTCACVCCSYTAAFPPPRKNILYETLSVLYNYYKSRQQSYKHYVITYW